MPLIEVIKELERCIEIKLKRVRFWPLIGFYLDDPKFYSFYSRIQELTGSKNIFIISFITNSYTDD